TLEGELASSLAPGEAVLIERPLGEAWLPGTPFHFRQVAANHVEQRRLAGVVAISTLLDTAGPTAEVVRLDPTARTRRDSQPEPRPCVAVPRVFENAAECADGPKRTVKAAAIVAFVLALAGKLDGQGLPEPHLAPPLA